MQFKIKSMKAFLPALGLVFGATAGTIISVLCGFQIPFGIVIGAAAGLLFGLAILNLSADKKQDSDVL
jgi:predicted MFS family arabinose efflux permease